MLFEVVLPNFKLIFNELHKTLPKLAPEQNVEQELSLLSNRGLWQIPKESVFQLQVHIDFLLSAI